MLPRSIVVTKPTRAVGVGSAAGKAVGADLRPLFDFLARGGIVGEELVMGSVRGSRPVMRLRSWVIFQVSQAAFLLSSRMDAGRLAPEFNLASLTVLGSGVFLG